MEIFSAWEVGITQFPFSLGLEVLTIDVPQATCYVSFAEARKA
jgi:hypothetical protein